MSLKNIINNDIKKAMLSQNKEELEALRSIKSLILLAETQKGPSTELTVETENKLLMKATKQRKESAEIFKKNGRPELAKREYSQLEVINKYLPKQLSEEELVIEIKKLISRIDATGPQDMGKVIGLATKELAGKAEGKMIATTVKQLL